MKETFFMAIVDVLSDFCGFLQGICLQIPVILKLFLFRASNPSLDDILSSSPRKTHKNY